MNRWEQHWSQPPPDHSESGFHFHLGGRLEETVSELRALNWQIYHLPKRIAMQLRHHETAPKGLLGELKPLTQLLQSGLPYVQLGKRLMIVLALWAMAGIGNYSPEQAKQMLGKLIGLFLVH